MPEHGRLKSGRKREKGAVIPLDFGNALKGARTRKNISMPTLAARLKMSDAILSMYEGGQRLPPLRTLEAIERELTVSLRREWEAVKPQWEKYKREQKERKAQANQHLPPPPFVTSSRSATEQPGFLAIEDMSNLSAEDWEAYKRRHAEWTRQIDAIIAQGRPRRKRRS